MTQTNFHVPSRPISPFVSGRMNAMPLAFLDHIVILKDEAPDGYFVFANELSGS